MIITFEPLNESHFSLLLKWLEAPHVKTWWDQDISYTIDLVKEKFGKHIHGVVLSKNSNNKTYAYIICVNKEMIGYIQAYNAHDFAHENGLDLSVISGSICGVDLFIGDSNFLHRGWGARILNEFEKQILTSHFDWCLIDPAKDNLSAIKAFTKAGFTVFDKFQTKSNAWMIKELSDAPKESRITEASVLPKLIEALERSLLAPSVRQSIEQLNKLIADDFLEFGSSGKIYNKQDCVKRLPNESPKKFVANDFKVKELSENVMLVTYKTTVNGITALRSSIWQRYANEWQMIFHQGTKCEVEDECEK